MNRTFLHFGIFFVLFSMCFGLWAKDWKDIPVPVDPGPNKIWKLQKSHSDSFNYRRKGIAFRRNWRDTYINGWTGPGLTHWASENSWLSNGKLIIAASRREGTNKVNSGVVTSKKPVIYPVFIEARIKVSNLELSSNFWMLSGNDQREIDIVEVYGGAKQEWFARHMSTNFHVFFRDENTNDILGNFNAQSHNAAPNDGFWRDTYHRFGVYWKSPTEIAFYIDGKETPEGSWAQAKMFDKDISKTDLDKEQHNMDQALFMILDTEDHAWRSNQGIVADDASLADDSRNKMYVDWVRTYKPIEAR